MRKLFLLLMGLNSAFADEPDWARNSFKRDDGTYKYFVGLGDASREADSVELARKHAAQSLVDREFSESTSVNTQSVEATVGSSITRKQMT